MDLRKTHNILQTIPEDPRSPGAVGSPMMRAESDFGRSQDMGEVARFSMNGSAIKPAFSALNNNNNGPNPDVSSALKDLK